MRRLHAGLGMAGLVAAMLGGGMLGAPMLRPDEPRVREVRHVIGGKGMDRRIRKRLYQKRQRTLAMGRKKAQARDQFSRLIDCTRNYERCQWAKAGYPGLRGRDVEEARPYLGAAYRRMTGTYMVAGDPTLYRKSDGAFFVDTKLSA